MEKSTIVFLGNILIPISAAISLVLVVEVHPTSLKVLIFFGALTLAPYYLFEHFINFRSKNFRQAIENVGISCLCSLGEIYWIINTMFFDLDPQGGFVIIFTPLLQIGLFLLLRFLVISEKSSMHGKDS